MLREPSGPPAESVCSGGFALKGRAIVASTGLRVVREDEPAPRRNESPLKLLQSAIPAATNDEAVELAYRVLENLAERCEIAADMAIDSDNRDVENEALVFIKEVDSLAPAYYKNDRLKESTYVVDDAEQDLETAIRNRRRRLSGDRSALESFSRRRQRRVSSAWEVERRREAVAGDRTLAKANITGERVLQALTKVAAEAPVQAMHVAIAMLPELSDPSVVGRQRVITDVARHLRELAKAGKVTQIRPSENDDRRKTCRYAMPATGGRGA